MKELINSIGNVFEPPKIERFSVDADIEQLSRLYADVFSGPPWNEFTRCPDEKIYFGKETKPGDCCVNCGKKLDLAYPLNETREYIRDEYLRPNSHFLVAKIDNEIIGFSWGFVFQSPEEFALDKYKTKGLQDKVVDVLKANGVEKDFFYFSEAGIVEKFRGKGISNGLSNALSDMALDINLPMVIRTNCNSPIVKIANNLEMTLVSGPVSIMNRDKKGFIRTGEIANFLDNENSERVLFVRSSNTNKQISMPETR